MSKHTPGPWVLCHHLKTTEKDKSCPCGFPGDIWGVDQEHVVCGIGPHCVEGSDMVPRYDRETELANAKLIAAAPELLGWIKAVVRQMQYERPHAEKVYTNGGSGLFGMEPNLLKIIAKAEGES